jgi:hypothetical protein
MKINNKNYRHFSYFILFLIVVSTAIAFFINKLINIYEINLPFYIEIPSITLIYGILFYFFDNYFWKWRIFKIVGIIVADNLNGKWMGVAKTSYDNFLNDIPVTLNIKQTATGVVIQGIFDSSKSISLNANFERSEVDDSVALFYFYRNEPNYDAVNTMATHEGSVKLIYNKVENRLEGSYYSGRDRNNYGTLKVFKQ